MSWQTKDDDDIFFLETPDGDISTRGSNKPHILAIPVGEYNRDKHPSTYTSTPTIQTKVKTAAKNIIKPGSSLPPPLPLKSLPIQSHTQKQSNISPFIAGSSNSARQMGALHWEESRKRNMPTVVNSAFQKPSIPANSLRSFKDIEDNLVNMSCDFIVELPLQHEQKDSPIDLDEGEVEVVDAPSARRSRGRLGEDEEDPDVLLVLSRADLDVFVSEIQPRLDVCHKVRGVPSPADPHSADASRLLHRTQTQAEAAAGGRSAGRKRTRGSGNALALTD